MKNYIVYDDNGMIIKSGICADIDFHLQGKNVIEGICDGSTQFVKNEKVKDLPLRPNGEAWEFDFIKHEWTRNKDILRQLIKQQRNIFLAETDWTDTVSASKRLGEKYIAWQNYRQALRDITAQSEYPENVVWPEKP